MSVTFQPSEIKVGRTYATAAAEWTATGIRPTGMVDLHRDDGRTAAFGLQEFAGRVLRELPPLRMSMHAALKQADEKFGSIYHVNSGTMGWGYQSWSEKHKAWFVPMSGTTYQYAKANRARDIAVEAMMLMIGSTDSEDGFEFQCEKYHLEGGAARERLLKARGLIDG